MRIILESVVISLRRPSQIGAMTRIGLLQLRFQFLYNSFAIIRSKPKATFEKLKHDRSQLHSTLTKFVNKASLLLGKSSLTNDANVVLKSFFHLLNGTLEESGTF